MHHPVLQAILNTDAAITKHFVSVSDNISVFKCLKKYSGLLEISCHGIVWLSFWIAFTWIFNHKDVIQLQVNMLIGLCVDIILVALIKAYARRKRPSPTNDVFSRLGPDLFSFPSGHASRSFFVFYVFTYLYPVHYIWIFLCFTWATCVSISRLLLHRHYVLDILGGICLGFIEGFLMNMVWMDQANAEFLLSFLSDEQIVGGEV